MGLRRSFSKFILSCIKKIDKNELVEFINEVEFRYKNSNRDNDPDKDILKALQQKATREAADFAFENFQNAIPLNSREEIMDFAIEHATNEGFIAEFGVFMGASLNRIAKILPEETIHGFDTFTGLPENWRIGINAGYFDTSPFRLTFEKNCKLHKGLFSETLPDFIGQVEGNAKLIHIDCDLYQGAKDIFNLLGDRIVSGTVLVFDEFINYDGWREHEYKAFMEFVQEKEIKFKYIAFHCKREQVVVMIE